MDMENKGELEQRIAMLENRIKIKEDEKNKFFYFDNNIDGKRGKTMER